MYNLKINKMSIVKLELTPKEMRILYCFGVTAMSNHLKDHKTIMGKEKETLEHKLWLAFKQTEINN
jgi:hypothetical protein